MLPFRRAASPAETVEAARELGFPVAIKAIDERWRHRADGAGVRLTVVTHQGARQAFTDLSRLSGRDEVYVQRMGAARHLLRLRADRRPVVRHATVVRALRYAQRAARRPRLSGASAVPQVVPAVEVALT